VKWSRQLDTATSKIRALENANLEGIKKNVKIEKEVKQLESTLLKTSNELADKMETRTSLEENPLESRVLTTIDEKLDLLKKHNDDSLTDMETRVTKKQKEDFEHLDGFTRKLLFSTTLVDQRISSFGSSLLKLDRSSYSRMNLIEQQNDDSLTSMKTEYRELIERIKKSFALY
jgi:hypothetical protein